MAQCDAAGVNGSNRILSHGAPQPRMMPNGCLGSPVIVLLLVLTEASSWMSVRCRLRESPWLLRSRGPEQKSLRREFTSACRTDAQRSYLPDLSRRFCMAGKPRRRVTPAYAGVTQCESMV